MIQNLHKQILNQPGVRKRRILIKVKSSGICAYGIRCRTDRIKGLQNTGNKVSHKTCLRKNQQASVHQVFWRVFHLLIKSFIANKSALLALLSVVNGNITTTIQQYLIPTPTLQNTSHHYRVGKYTTQASSNSTAIVTVSCSECSYNE